MENIILCLFGFAILCFALIALHFIGVCILYVIYRLDGGKLSFVKYWKVKRF